jgi:hypothetical protein
MLSLGEWCRHLYGQTVHQQSSHVELLDPEYEGTIIFLFIQHAKLCSVLYSHYDLSGLCHIYTHFPIKEHKICVLSVSTALLKHLSYQKEFSDIPRISFSFIWC